MSKTILIAVFILMSVSSYWIYKIYAHVKDMALILKGTNEILYKDKSSSIDNSIIELKKDIEDDIEKFKQFKDFLMIYHDIQKIRRV